MPAQTIEHGALAVGGRSHRRMSALAGQGNPPCPGWDDTRDAEPGTWAEHAERRALGRNATTHRQPVFRFQMRQGTLTLEW